MRRRELLVVLGAAMANCALRPRLLAADAPEFDENLLVFLADIHAGASGKCARARSKFAEVVAEILKMRPRPRNVVVQTAFFDLKSRRFVVVLTTRCGEYDRAKHDRFAAIAALMRPYLGDAR